MALNFKRIDNNDNLMYGSNHEVAYAIMENSMPRGWVARCRQPNGGVEWCGWNVWGDYWMSCESSREAAGRALLDACWRSFVRYDERLTSKAIAAAA